MHPDRGLDALQAVVERAGIARGSADERQGWLADLFAALGVTLNGPLTFAGGCGGFGSKSLCLNQVANLATCPVAAVPGLRVQLQIDRRAPRRLAGAAWDTWLVIPFWRWNCG